MLPSSKAIFLKGWKWLVIDLSIVNQQVLYTRYIPPKKNVGETLSGCEVCTMKKPSKTKSARSWNVEYQTLGRITYPPQKMGHLLSFPDELGPNFPVFTVGWHVTLPWRDLDLWIQKSLKLSEFSRRKAWSSGLLRPGKMKTPSRVDISYQYGLSLHHLDSLHAMSKQHVFETISTPKSYSSDYWQLKTYNIWQSSSPKECNKNT